MKMQFTFNYDGKENKFIVEGKDEDQCWDRYEEGLSIYGINYFDELYDAENIKSMIL